MKKRKSLNLNYKVFVPAALFMLAFILYGALAPESFAKVTTALHGWAGNHFTWAALAVAVLITITTVWMAISKFGNTIIGGPDAKPEFTNFQWITMIICGNIGIAMMFYAVVEPLTDFMNPPTFWQVAAETDAAIETAVAQAAFHWGGITWCANMLIGFVSIFLCLNYGLPFRPSTSLYPILKNRIFGPLGTAYDAFTLVGIIGAIVTGFGLGVMQFGTGLSYVTGIELNNTLYTIIIIATTLVLIFSSTRGLKKGLAVFSAANSWMYLAILIFLLAVGPTIKLLELIVGSAGALIDKFIPMAFNGDFLGDDNGWNVSRTGFTWFWFFVYGPFTGMYLTKISKGRKVRHFLGTTILIPTAFLLVWFALWGGNAVNLQHFLNYDLMSVINEWGAPVANFVTLEHLPLKWLFIPIVLVCVMIGFITLVDGLANVIAGMCVKKVVNMETSPVVRAFWCIILAAATLVCLFVLDEGGMATLQSLTVVLAVPLIFTAAAICIGIFKLCSGKVTEYLNTPAGQADIERAKASVENSVEL